MEHWSFAGDDWSSKLERHAKVWMTSLTQFRHGSNPSSQHVLDVSLQPLLLSSWPDLALSTISDCKNLPCLRALDHALTNNSPVLARSVMGMYGSYFFVFIRAVVCIIWYGIQTFYAGNLISVMLRCVFGSSWHNFPNALPANANITSKKLLTFFLAWLLEFPFVSAPDHRE